MCRPPSKPQIDKIIKILRPEIMPGRKLQITGLPSKSPCILNVNREVVGIIKKENLSYVVPRPRPLPKPPPKYL